MTAAVLLDHVSAYAAAVRHHLADLSPEQVDDLTDGLEADLAEALEDPSGAVATGEIPLGGPVAARATAGEHPPHAVPSGGLDSASLIDLTLRFGPAAAYAAELRAAAGLGPASTQAGRRQPVRDGVRSLVGDLRARALAAASPVTSSAQWPAIAGFVVALRPLWWLLRGWVWFVVAAWALRGFLGLRLSQVFVPAAFWSLVLLGVALVVSVQWGRGRAVSRPVWQRLLRVGHVIAVVLVLPLLVAFWNHVEHRVGSTETIYIDNTAYGPSVEDGVYVDGMQVSNLFVYDAEGNPLSGVQIFDDRGRPVRTTSDEGWAEWSLPGVDEPWSFGAVEDTEGRLRWNVYPLTGAPWMDWSEDEQGNRVPAPGVELRVPPSPFAKAPAVVVPGLSSGGDDTAGDSSAGDDRVAGEADDVLPDDGGAGDADGTDGDEGDGASGDGTMEQEGPGAGQG